MVLGYPGGIEIDLAMERGEVAARGGFGPYAGIRQERPDWLSQKKVNVIVQIGSERDKDFPDVPLMHELATMTEQRQVLGLISSPVALGRPFFAPPGIPADRLAALRRAFDATMTDERYGQGRPAQDRSRVADRGADDRNRERDDRRSRRCDGAGEGATGDAGKQTGRLEHDLEKWKTGFRKRSCSVKKLESDPFQLNRIKLRRRIDSAEGC